MSVDDEHLTHLEQQLLKDVSELEKRISDLEQLVKEEDKERSLPPTRTDVHDDTVHPKEVIESLPGAREDGVPVETVFSRLAEEGFDPTRQVDKLRRHGEIYNPTPDLIRVV